MVYLVNEFLRKRVQKYGIICSFGKKLGKKMKRMLFGLFRLVGEHIIDVLSIFKDDGHGLVPTFF